MSLAISYLERMSPERPVRWEGTDNEGRRVGITYTCRLLTVEIDYRVYLSLTLPEGHPGATEHTLSNAGLKQALLLVEPRIYLPF